MLRAFKVSQEPGDGSRSPGDGAASDTPFYRTFSLLLQGSFRAVSEQWQDPCHIASDFSRIANHLGEFVAVFRGFFMFNRDFLDS